MTQQNKKNSPEKTKKGKKKKPCRRKRKSGKNGPKRELTKWQNEKGQFVKGNLANPGGRPRGARSLTGILRETMEQEAGRGKTFADLFINKLVSLSIKEGNMNAIREVFERLDGKVPDQIKHEYGPDWEVIFDLADGNSDDSNNNDNGKEGNAVEPE